MVETFVLSQRVRSILLIFLINRYFDHQEFNFNVFTCVITTKFKFKCFFDLCFHYFDDTRMLLTYF